MEQNHFSDLMKDFLGSKFPEFLTSVNNLPDGSFDCSLESPTRQFSIWIASYDCEVTVGLEYPDGSSGCHTHYTPYGPEDVPGAFQRLAGTVDDIRANRLCFYHSSRSGYSWPSDAAKTLAERKAQEYIRIFSWDGTSDFISN